MDKKEFINKYSRGTETSIIDIRKSMMVDLNILINKIVKEEIDKEFNRRDCE